MFSCIICVFFIFLIGESKNPFVGDTWLTLFRLPFLPNSTEGRNAFYLSDLLIFVGELITLTINNYQLSYKIYLFIMISYRNRKI